MTKLTQKLVLNHVLPISGYQIIWCSSLPGFGVRLSSGGKRSYVAQYVCRASRRSRLLSGVTHLKSNDTIF
jgi:hypothetical protein